MSPMPTIQHPEEGQINVEDLDFETVKEDWNEYETEDGTTLKVKLVVNRIMRSDDVHNELGEPFYTVSAQNVVRSVDVPDELKEE